MSTYVFEYEVRVLVTKRIDADDGLRLHSKEFKANDDNEALKIVENEKQKGRMPSRLLKVIKTNW